MKMANTTHTPMVRFCRPRGACVSGGLCGSQPTTLERKSSCHPEIEGSTAERILWSLGSGRYPIPSNSSGIPFPAMSSPIRKPQMVTEVATQKRAPVPRFRQLLNTASAIRAIIPASIHVRALLGSSAGRLTISIDCIKSAGVCSKGVSPASI